MEEFKIMTAIKVVYEEFLKSEYINNLLIKNNYNYCIYLKHYSFVEIKRVEGLNSLYG